MLLNTLAITIRFQLFRSMNRIGKFLCLLRTVNLILEIILPFEQYRRKQILLYCVAQPLRSVMPAD